MSNKIHWLKRGIIYLICYLVLAFAYSKSSGGDYFIFLFWPLLTLAPFVFLTGALVGYLDEKNKIYGGIVKFLFFIFVLLQIVLSIYSSDRISYENTKYRYFNPDIAVCIGKCPTYEKSYFFDTLTSLKFLKVKILD